MTFILKNQRVFEKDEKSWERLADVLKDYSNSINTGFAGFSYHQHVYFNVINTLFEPPVLRVYVGFRSKDKIKYPGRYGESFRTECINFALQKAEDLLDTEYNTLEIHIREDFNLIEICEYERQSLESGETFTEVS